MLPEGHPLAKRRRVSQAQVQAESLVHTPRLGVFLREDGFDLGHSKGNLEVNSVATIFNYVAAGFGVSILARQFTILPVPGICFVPYTSKHPFRYGMAWRRGGENVEPLASFLMHAREVARRRGYSPGGRLESGSR